MKPSDLTFEAEIMLALLRWGRPTSQLMLIELAEILCTGAIVIQNSNTGKIIFKPKSQ